MPVSRGLLIRPVLCCTRKELKSFCRDRGIRYAIDKSNLDNKFLRNRIRNKLLPLLRKDFNPSIDEAILRMGINITEGWNDLEGEISGMIPPVRRGGAVTIPIGRLEDLSDYKLYILVDILLRERMGIFQDFGRIHFDAIRKLIASGRSGSSIDLPHGLVVSRDQNNLRFTLGDRKPTPPGEISIPGEGTFELPGWGMTAKISIEQSKGTSFKASKNKAHLSGVSFPIKIAPRRRGDKLVPFGMKGRRKLSDIMVDRKVPYHERDMIPVFSDSKGIIWVPGVVTAERTRITGRTRRVTAIALEGKRSDGES
jgi:tRNA(Ile)-lysidine synthase